MKKGDAVHLSRSNALHDGSFVAPPGRDIYEKGYDMSSRLHPTVTMALVFGMDDPFLQIQGQTLKMTRK